VIRRRPDAAAVLRLTVGGALAFSIGSAILAAETNKAADAIAIFVATLTFWNPVYGLAAVLGATPFGLLLAGPPVRLAELLTWTLVSAWLLRMWRPLAQAPPPRDVLVPLALYFACALGSWVGQAMRGAAGVEAAALPVFLFRQLASGHLVLPMPEPETWTWLQTAAGLALFAASLAITGNDALTRRVIAWTAVASVSCVALVTLVDVGRQTLQHGAEFFLRYVRGERFSLHVADLNAAGSLYVLGILVAATLAYRDRPRRWMWTAASVVVLPALWLTGSRSASLGAILVGIGVIPLARSGVSARARRGAIVTFIVLTIAAAGAGILFAQQPAEQGSAAQSMRIRGYFLLTSARMLVSAPVYGIGIGRYHERSNEFMPPELRAIYPYENAHNYFAQQFGELGLLGGALFLWLVTAALVCGRRSATSASDPEALALFAASAGYVLTCITGHPLLVPETALPFWVVLGAAASVPAEQHASHRRRVVSAVVLVAIAIGVALHAVSYARPAGPPPERGFLSVETGEDGRSFVWMTRHGVWHVGAQPGFLTIPVRAPEQPARGRAFALDVDVEGWRVGTYEVPSAAWTDIVVPLRRRSTRPFRRVDLWANQVWVPPPPGTAAQIPRSVMVGEVRWNPAGSR
jgi:O-antigen ligase